MRNKTLFNLFMIAIIVASLSTVVACKPADQATEPEVTAAPDTSEMPADVSATEAPEGATEDGGMTAADEEAGTAEQPMDEAAPEGAGEEATEAGAEG